MSITEKPVEGSKDSKTIYLGPLAISLGPGLALKTEIIKPTLPKPIRSIYQTGKGKPEDKWLIEEPHSW